ncbi:MAG: DNA-directed RNA polymerase subunit beta' [Chloroflexi bacterium CG08_land_8_20_14_0_20_45_12]|nr:MAG: DNA-directed RNA polymerase subunit beta' [Chloroflexi bacterium CG08_land_8_20_14_0_20_45_12]
MPQFDAINGIRISLASPEQIRSWSHGEITKAETINYRTFKPERDGLFCEKIFGPTKDFECHCGKYKKSRYKGVICDKCGVEVAHSSVRRERMGHIELAAPVTHIWFVKLVPSRLGLLLNLSPRSLDGVIYFARYIVTSIDDEAKQKRIQQLEEEMAQKATKLEEQLDEEVEKLEIPRLSLRGTKVVARRSRSKLGAGIPRLRSEQTPSEEDLRVREINQLRANAIAKLAQNEEELRVKREELEKLQPLRVLTEEEYRELNEKYGEIFKAGMGAEAILEILRKIDIDKLHQELLEQIRTASGQYHKKLSKRLQLVEAFKLSGNKPEWTVLTVLPVLPPALRPIVQMGGGRFVISDLNDLYRRVINRNNRLRRLMRLGAPQIILRNEKRMLQEAVDALIDNGRRGRIVTTGNNHELKSLAAILSGKRGRFRQNLLGKRVDYSGRSVIVVGPKLKLHQCGLPRHVALELFKPFVIHKLVEKGYASNPKSAKRQMERRGPEVWEALNEAIKGRPILLNRAPTLHRLSIQAFEPVLIDGDAFQIHPLVCSAFNADFDGDQMAVHVPLSRAAVKEAREYMLSPYNILSPSCGEPVAIPTLDMVLGCYYLTTIKPGARSEIPEGRFFSNFEEARFAYELGTIEICAQIVVRDEQGKRINTTVGRILFNEALPPQLRFCNKVMDKAALRTLVSDSIRLLGNETTAAMLDSLKQLGFDYATKSGISIAMNDVEGPPSKFKLLKEAEEKVRIVGEQFSHGLITEGERYENTVQVWMETTDKIIEEVSRSLDHYGGIYMMVTSGAKGNISQVTQMAGMRGLMTDPSGKIIEFPIKSSFRDGLTPMEYFISIHGARKGLADTALRTSDSGYLTRRLIDVAQDAIVTEMDCGTTEGVWMSKHSKDGSLPPFNERIIGYLAASKIVDPRTGEVIVERNEVIDEDRVKRIIEADIEQLYLRSPLTCRSRLGVCQSCYGRDLGRGQLVNFGTAVGIIAAQSIGEPGTQLTLRTFHTGGVVGTDITTGLPRVEELFEARIPKNAAIISEIDGIVEVTQSDGENLVVKVSNTESYLDEYPIPPGATLLVSDKQWVSVGTTLVKDREPEVTDSGLMTTRPSPNKAGGEEGIPSRFPVVARVSGQVIFPSPSRPLPNKVGGVEGLPFLKEEDKGEAESQSSNILFVKYEERESRECIIPARMRLLVKSGDKVKAGQTLTEGIIDPHDILHILGKEAVQQYLLDEVQKVYRSQGVNIHDKHIAIIVRQMLSYVRITSSGDSKLLPEELVSRFVYEDINAKVLAEGGEPATAQAILLGVTRASLSKDSWLAAASFQETARVLVDAAIKGKTDKLIGLKGNVILGRLIPARVLDEQEIQEAKTGIQS